MYYPCSENKGADQLRGYREADLRLYFRICKKPFFSQRGSNVVSYNVLIWNTCIDIKEFVAINMEFGIQGVVCSCLEPSCIKAYDSHIYQG